MQRQSLGPPSGKLPNTEEKWVNLASPETELGESSSSSSEDDFKAEKTIRSKSDAHRSIHLIPLLTLLCLLILYLCSHDPKDPAAGGGFSAIVDLKGISTESVGRFLWRERAGPASARTRRESKEARRFLHRKLGSS